jgi:hypothetical protein
MLNVNSYVVKYFQKRNDKKDLIKPSNNGQHLGTKFKPFKPKSRPTNGANIIDKYFFDKYSIINHTFFKQFIMSYDCYHGQIFPLTTKFIIHI